MKPVSRLILPPLARNFQNRIDARGPLKMEWEMKKCTARIVSHRASLIGDQSENTGYRQVVFRLDSKQVLKLRDAGSNNGWMSHASKNSSPKGLRWVPEQAAKKSRDVDKTSDRTSLEFADNGETKRVVEYLVLQKRVVKGKEEDWKVWGFAQESTPEVIEEDDAYWRKTMAAQAEQA
jgi:protein MBA1